MKKYLLISLFIISCLAIEVIAQIAIIEGIVVEKESQEILKGAAVALYHRDSILITGIVTDSVGKFKLTSIPMGNYYIEISFIGFTSHYISNISLSENKNFGIINLEISKKFLEAVSVTSKKSILINDLNKQIYDVDQDILSETSSVSEILQNIPSVVVDINKGISVRNTNNVTFFINGKPSAMLRRNALSVLEQFPASSIERIEIITNPSAKYLPDGVGGIINIVLKKEVSNGINGLIGANIGTESRYNGKLNLNYGSENFNIFSNYSIRNSAATFLYADERLYKVSDSDIIRSRYYETGSSNIKARSHNIFAGINYEINDYNSVELSGTYFSQNSLHKGFSTIALIDSTNNPEYDFINNQTNDEFEREGETNLTYEHIFKDNEDHRLVFETAFSAFKEKEDLVFHRTNNFPSGLTNVSNILIQKSGNQQEIIIDYTLPLSQEAEFESGYAVEFINEDIKYDRTANASQLLFNQNIHALYATFVQSFEDFSAKIGLRAEQTNITLNLKTPSHILIQNNYFKLFPTIHLRYELNDKQQISLGYSKRLNRPDADALNPNLEFGDPQNAESGNPELKPEQVHSLELGYQILRDEFSFSTAIYYRFKYDAFTDIQYNIGDSILLSTMANLDIRQSIGLETVLSGKLSNNWNLGLTGDIFYTTIRATNLGYEDSNKSSISGYLKAHTFIKLGKSTSFQLNAFYHFPTITPQGKRNQYFYSNGGIKQQLFENRASLTFTISDIFHTYKVIHHLQTNELDRISSIERKLPVVYFGFIWRFNNDEEREKLIYESGGLRK